MSTAKLLSDRYELGDVLGYGGMSEVHLGRDIRLSRDVAVKILRADLASDTVFQERFRREAQNSAALSHPAIVAVYDTGETGTEFGKLPYIVMEYVDGRTLRDIVKTEGPMDAKRAMEIMADTCAALDFSHRHGIIHRDVKPANVMISKTGAVKVMDFGIARAIHDGQSTMTQTAAVIGTAQYLSPEQARGESVDARSDVYAAGCVLYELITGEPPFTGDSPVAVAYQHVREDPDPPSSRNPAISPELDAVVLKALSKGPANRYQSAAEMRSDLVRVLSDQRPNAPMVMSDDERTQLMGSSAPAPAIASEADEEEARRKRRRRFLVGAAVIAVAAVIGLLWLLNPLQSTASEKIPPVLGQQFNPAEQRLRDAGFTNINPQPVVCKPQTVDAKAPCDPVKDDGKVFNVTPAAGTKVATDTEITLKYGQAPKQFKMPDLTGQKRTDAQKTAQDAGLFVKINPKQIDNTDPNRDGHVAQQTPAADSNVREGDVVTLTLYKSTQKVEVTDYTGKKLDVAQAGLEGAGFKVAAHNVDSDQPKGTVVKQDPANGEVVAGSVVNLDVSNGADVMVTMPNLVGESDPNKAAKALKDAGFTGGYRSVKVPVDDPNQKNVVQRTDPRAGSKAQASDVPTLFVGVYQTKTTTPPPTTTTEETTTEDTPPPNNDTTTTKRKPGH